MWKMMQVYRGVEGEGFLGLVFFVVTGSCCYWLKW